MIAPILIRGSSPSQIFRGGFDFAGIRQGWADIFPVRHRVNVYRGNLDLDMMGCTLVSITYNVSRVTFPRLTRNTRTLHHMMTSTNGNIFRVTGPLCGEFTGHRWIPRTTASDAELWYFLWSAHWINGWVNNREAGDLRRHRAHYDVIVIIHEHSIITQSNKREMKWAHLFVADLGFSRFKLDTCRSMVAMMDVSFL